jgi:hypothetical protein
VNKISSAVLSWIIPAQKITCDCLLRTTDARRYLGASHMLKTICMSVQLSGIAENTKVCLICGGECVALEKDVGPTATTA